MDDQREYIDVDKDAMMKMLSKSLAERINIEKRYFEQLAYMTKSNKVIKAVMDNIMEMPISDQLLIIETSCKTAKVCEVLNNKYGFYEEDLDE